MDWLRSPVLTKIDLVSHQFGRRGLERRNRLEGHLRRIDGLPRQQPFVTSGGACRCRRSGCRSAARCRSAAGIGCRAPRTRRRELSASPLHPESLSPDVRALEGSAEDGNDAATAAGHLLVLGRRAHLHANGEGQRQFRRGGPAGACPKSRERRPPEQWRGARRRLATPWPSRTADLPQMRRSWRRSIEWSMRFQCARLKRVR